MFVENHKGVLYNLHYLTSINVFHTREGEWEIRTFVGTTMVVLYAFAEESEARSVFEALKKRIDTIELKSLIPELN